MCYTLSTLENTYPVVDISSLLQAELSNRDARTADLQENVKSQQAEAVKAKEELTNALTAMEKLKETCNKERADWETEKSRFNQKSWRRRGSPETNCRWTN